MDKIWRALGFTFGLVSMAVGGLLSIFVVADDKVSMIDYLAPVGFFTGVFLLGWLYAEVHDLLEQIRDALKSKH